MTSNQKIIKANGVDLCVETFGEPSNPAILLIMGAAASMDWWPVEFCQQLADGNRYVIRYDLRDIGQSISYEPGKPEYTGADLNQDAISLLDALNIERAHIVGVSMGGGIAQHLVNDYPDRVASLTLISTMAEGPLAAGDSDDEQFGEQQGPQVNWSDDKAVLEYMVKDTQQIQGSVHVEEADLRDLLKKVIARTKNIESSNMNHWVLAPGDSSDINLDKIDMPTLVMHGTEDPLIPYHNGEELAKAIPGAKFIPLEGVGHGELPQQVWDIVVPAILDIATVNQD